LGYLVIMKDAVYVIGIPSWFVGHCQCRYLNTNLIILKGSFIIENNQLLCQYNHRNPTWFCSIRIKLEMKPKGVNWRKLIKLISRSKLVNNLVTIPDYTCFGFIQLELLLFGEI
jgi:hypothetical protein